MQPTPQILIIRLKTGGCVEQQATMTQRQKDSLNKEEFETLIKKDKKRVVKTLAQKMADSPDLKDIWVNSQVDGIKPLIDWSDDELKTIAKDFFDWK